MRPGTTASENAAAIYRRYIAELSRIGTTEFNLSLRQSRSVAHEVLIASIGSRFRIGDMRAWLIASMRAAAAQRRTRAEG